MRAEKKLRKLENAKLSEDKTDSKGKTTTNTTKARSTSPKKDTINSNTKKSTKSKK